MKKSSAPCARIRFASRVLKKRVAGRAGALSTSELPTEKQGSGKQWK